MTTMTTRALLTESELDAIEARAAAREPASPETVARLVADLRWLRGGAVSGVVPLTASLTLLTGDGRPANCICDVYFSTTGMTGTPDNCPFHSRGARP